MAYIGAMGMQTISREPFLIAVIKLNIDVEPLATATKKIVSEYKSKYEGKIDFTKPFSIEMTSSGNSRVNDIVNYEKVHNRAFFDRNNKATLQKKYTQTAFTGLIAKLPFPFSIIRLSVLPPCTIIKMHTDKACHAQLAMSTNQDCFVAARSGETKHVPADGNLYIISTTLPHMAYNASSEERTHISISIFDEDYTQLLKKNAGRNI